MRAGIEVCAETIRKDPPDKLGEKRSMSPSWEKRIPRSRERACGPSTTPWKHLGWRESAGTQNFEEALHERVLEAGDEGEGGDVAQTEREIAFRCKRDARIV